MAKPTNVRRRRPALPSPQPDGRSDHQRAYEDGFKGALVEVLMQSLLRSHETPGFALVPFWACQAALRKIVGADGGKTGSGNRNDFRRHAALMKHKHRYEIMERALADGAQWNPSQAGTKDVCEVASSQLAGTEFQGTESAMKKSYGEILRIIKEGKVGLLYPGDWAGTKRLAKDVPPTQES